MSDVCDQYLVRAKREAEDQYASLRSALSGARQRAGWKVEQVSFITGEIDNESIRCICEYFQMHV